MENRTNQDSAVEHELDIASQPASLQPLLQKIKDEGWTILDHPLSLSDGSVVFFRHTDGRALRVGGQPKYEEAEASPFEEVFPANGEDIDPTMVLELKRRLAEAREITSMKNEEIRKLEATRALLREKITDQDARIIRLRDFGTSAMVLALALGVVIAVQNVFVPLLRDEKKPRLNKDAPVAKKQEEPSLAKSTSQFQVFRFDDYKEKKTDDASHNNPRPEHPHGFLFNEFHEDMEKLLMVHSAGSISRPLLFDSTVFPRSEMSQWRPRRLGGVRLTGAQDSGTGTSDEAAKNGTPPKQRNSDGRVGGQSLP
jgi:hypothetical protein